MSNTATNTPGNTTNTSAIKDALSRLGDKGRNLGKWVWNHKTISALIASGILNCFSVAGCYEHKQDAKKYEQQATTNGVNADQYLIDLQSARDSISALEEEKQRNKDSSASMIDQLTQALEDCKTDSLTAYKPRKEIQATAKDLGLVCSRIRKSIGLDSASLNKGILIIRDKLKSRFARDSVTIDNEQYPFTNDGQRATYYRGGHNGSIELSDKHLIMKEHVPGGNFQVIYEYKDGKMTLESTQITLFFADGTKIYTKCGDIIVVQHIFDNDIKLETTYNAATGEQIAGEMAE